MRSSAVVATFLALCLAATDVLCSWEEWWTYEGISGPDFWGLLNPEWKMCSKGRRQSPVDIDPSILLYDPQLRPLHLDKLRVNGYITNTGHSIVFRVESTPHSPIVNISSGPLSYNYRFEEIHLHYGKTDSFGSEHSISGQFFAAEVQIYGYNSDLYGSMAEAALKSQGLVAVSLLLQVGDLTNVELRLLTSQLQKIVYKGQEAYLKSFSLRELVPQTPFYLTYDGSTTMPGCYETVTWIVINRPLSISRPQLYGLRKLMQGESTHPKAPLANNFRPTQAMHHRLIRTNIDFPRQLRICSVPGVRAICSLDVALDEYDSGPAPQMACATYNGTRHARRGARQAAKPDRLIQDRTTDVTTSDEDLISQCGNVSDEGMAGGNTPSPTQEFRLH